MDPKVIVGKIQRLNALVEQMQQLARYDDTAALNPESLDLVVLLKQALDV